MVWAAMWCHLWFDGRLVCLLGAAMRIAIVDGRRRHAIEDEDYRYELADEWPAARNFDGQGMAVAVSENGRVAQAWMTAPEYRDLRDNQKARDMLVGRMREEVQNG